MLNLVTTEVGVVCDTAEVRSVSGRLPPEGAVGIRPYRPADRAAVRPLCCDTGFLGGPVDGLFQDQELFANLFTRPYLEHEPESAYVAVAEQRVVGYFDDIPSGLPATGRGGLCLAHALSCR